MSARRTIRQFTAQPVSQELLHNAIATAGSAPSGANRQPWFFALIQSQEVKQEVRIRTEIVEQEFYAHKAPSEWLEALAPLGTQPSKPYLTEAPAIIAVFSRTRSELTAETFGKTYYPIESTGIATGLLIASLHAAGLAVLTHTPAPMHFLNDVLQLDRTYRPFLLVVVGYPRLPLDLPKLKRKALDAIMRRY